MELPINGKKLPYIMATYKFHKKKYRWIKNAFGSIFANITILITISTMAPLEEVGLKLPQLVTKISSK